MASSPWAIVAAVLGFQAQQRSNSRPGSRLYPQTELPSMISSRFWIPILLCLAILDWMATIHPLVQEWARCELSPIEHSIYQTTAVCLDGTARPGLELPSYSLMQQRLLSHAYCSLKSFSIPNDLSEIALLGLHGIGYMFFERGRYTEGIE